MFKNLTVEDYIMGKFVIGIILIFIGLGIYFVLELLKQYWDKE